MSELKVAFEMRKIRLPVDSILPLRQVKDPLRNNERYRSILASIKEVGLVEPVVVYPTGAQGSSYTLLDGHLRLLALKQLGEQTVECIVATGNECFTYNSRVSRLAPIQEHRMIMKAVKSGVRPARIAAALNKPVADVKAAMTLLKGIHEETVDILKDKPISPKALRLLRRVTPVRQIEIAELMVSTSNYTKLYVEALILGTPKDQLANPEEPKKKQGISREQIAKLEAEMTGLERDLRSVEQSYGENVLNLTLARSYIKRLLEITRVVRFLGAGYREILAEFESLAAAEGLG